MTQVIISNQVIMNSFVLFSCVLIALTSAGPVSQTLFSFQDGLKVDARPTPYYSRELDGTVDQWTVIFHNNQDHDVKESYHVRDFLKAADNHGYLVAHKMPEMENVGKFDKFDLFPIEVKAQSFQVYTFEPYVVNRGSWWLTWLCTQLTNKQNTFNEHT